MPDPNQWGPRGGRAPDPQSGAVYGTVSTLQPAPGAFTDPVFVIFDHDPDHALRFDDWPVIHGATLPALGADVLVLYDSEHNPRLVWWQGENT